MNAFEFGLYLRGLRKSKKMTIRQLELYAGVSNAYLSHIENGKRGIPSPDILKKLSKHLGVNYEELMKKAGYINSTSVPSLQKSINIPSESNVSEITKKITKFAIDEGYSLDDPKFADLVDTALDIIKRISENKSH